VAAAAWPVGWPRAAWSEGVRRSARPDEANTSATAAAPDRWTAVRGAQVVRWGGAAILDGHRASSIQ
jgi:hypothetical protein